MKKISVIIPCYKDAATLARALNSVYMQTYPVDEVIVVNDNSPETKLIDDIIALYPNVIYIKNFKNSGLANSRNIGVHHSSTEIVTFLDADDELHPQKIEFQLKVFDKSKVYTCSHRRIQDEIGVLNAKYFDEEFLISVISSNRMLLWRSYLTGAAIMISRELFNKIGGYDGSLRSSEDYDLWLRILENKITVVNINLPLYLYRFNENGLSKNYVNISHWEFIVLNKYFNSTSNEINKLFLKSLVLAFSVLRQIYRYEICKEKKLLCLIQNNILYFGRFSFLSLVLKIIFRLRVCKFIFYIKNKL